MHTAVAQRFGAGARPEAPIQWLSDNGSIDSALETVGTAERHHLEPITSGADRSTAAAVLEAIAAWIADYHAVAPHSALGFRAPQQYRVGRALEMRSPGLDWSTPAVSRTGAQNTCSMARSTGRGSPRRS